MATPIPSQVTQLLAAVNKGDAAAADRLWQLVYDELHRLAKHQLAKDARHGMVQPTSLVHEAYMRLTAGEDVQWSNRRHFFAAAAQAMRRIRVDYARKRDSLKYGGDHQRQVLGERPDRQRHDPDDVLAVDEALRKLEQEHPQRAEIVILRYFAGLSIDETATALGIAPRSVDKQWSFARAWLHRELSKGDTGVTGTGT